MDMGKVVEYDSTGKELWSNTPGGSVWSADRLKNGNTLIAGGGRVREVNPATAPVQALEVRPDKKIVWALRAWGNPVDLGPSTTIQLLDERSVPEAAHFGDLK